MDISSESSVALQRPVPTDGSRGGVGSLVSSAKQRVERSDVTGVGSGTVDAAVYDFRHHVDAETTSGSNFRPEINVIILLLLYNFKLLGTTARH
jgi:hypothetical protein